MSASSLSFPAAASPTGRRQAFTVVVAIELWERFGYYGMQAVLTLFMVQQLGMADRAVNLMIGAFVALTYISPLIGGAIGDRVLGARRTTVAGAMLLACGYAFLAVSLGSHFLLLLAMALISTGNGLFKPNAGNLVRRIYHGDDAALDSAFTLYYMSVNVGATVSMLLTPWLSIHYSPAVAFATCSAGLVVGLLYYALRSSRLDATTPPGERRPLPFSRFAAVMAGLVVMVAFNAWILGSNSLARLCVIVAGLILAAIWVMLYLRASRSERPGLRLAYLLCLQSAIYLIFYQQMQTSLTLFALRGVSGDYRIGGVTLFHMSAGQFQVLNSIWIMAFSPLLAALYNHLARQKRETAHARKMLVGYMMVAVGFGVWWMAASHAQGLVSPWIMVVGYAFLSLGELLTIGLGLAVVARYAPPRLSGFMMGGLYLMWGIAMYVGSVVANEAALPPDAVVAGASLYAGLFRNLCEAAACVVVFLAFLQPVCRRWDKEHATVISGEKEGLEL